MTKSQKRAAAAEIVARLITLYPAAECALQYEGEGWRLLVMGRLSAQCTDKRVNEVCIPLFARFKTPAELGEGDIREIEEIVRPCGLYRTKAQNIKDACRMLHEDFHDTVPQDMETLLTFPGVGRKIANLLRGDLYRLPAIVADTHCIRICERLGLTPRGCKDPVKTEQVMSELIEPGEQSDFCHRIVWFGRERCTARSPKCDGCPLYDLCPTGMKRNHE